MLDPDGVRRFSVAPPGGLVILGAHMPTAGGLPRALERGLTLGCDAVQIFTRNQLRWDAPPLEEAAVARFRELTPRFARVFAHGSYLTNLATPEQAAWDRSWRLLADELKRAAALGLPMLVVHPGSHRGSGARAGIRRVAEAMKRADGTARAPCVRVLFECTAGGGNMLGGRLEELRDLLAATGDREAGVGVCLDTCHLFAAGYDLRDAESYRRTMEEIRRVVGIRSVGAVHLNDSRGELGSRVDRHEHIGTGHIGRTGFRLLLNDRRFAAVPLCLETPKGEGLAEDCANLRVLRRLASRPPARAAARRPRRPHP
jgi:deoxyribonuclease-4